MARVNTNIFPSIFLAVLEALKRKAEPPNEQEFIGTYEKCKYGINQIAKLGHHLSSPSAGQLVKEIFKYIQHFINLNKGWAYSNKWWFSCKVRDYNYIVANVCFLLDICHNSHAIAYISVYWASSLQLVLHFEIGSTLKVQILKCKCSGHSMPYGL